MSPAPGVAVVGFCMGGGMALAAASAVPGRVKAAASASTAATSPPTPPPAPIWRGADHG